MNTPPPPSGPHEEDTRRTELAETHLALKQEPAAWQALAEARQEATAAERQRLARTLHATVAQSLTAIYFTAKGIEMKLQQDGSAVFSKMACLGDLIHQASNELHACIRGLEPDRPPPSEREESATHTGPLPAETLGAGPDSC